MLEGRTFVTGEAEIQSVYRSELSGIDGCLTLIEIPVKVYNIQEGEVEIALDSQLALNQASESEYLCASQTSFDILQDIRGRLRQLPIDIKWKWVEGHQDKKGKKLDWWAKQNQKVDLSAKDFAQNAIKYEYWRYRTPQLWYEKWGLRINASKRSCISRKDVLSVLATKRMKSYWHNHREFPVLDATKIAWKEQRWQLTGSRQDSRDGTSNFARDSSAIMPCYTSETKSILIIVRYAKIDARKPQHTYSTVIMNARLHSLKRK